MADDLGQRVARYVSGVNRYNPENLETLENYVTISALENFYDLEAYLAVLRLYQLSPKLYKQDIFIIIILKTFTNLPHSDLELCKCIQDVTRVSQNDATFSKILNLGDLLETCQFELFWERLGDVSHKTDTIKGFEESIRKYISHVVGITYQEIRKNDLKKFYGFSSDLEVDRWVSANNWKDQGNGYVFIANHEGTIKSKNITEKIDFSAVSGIMQSSSK